MDPWRSFKVVNSGVKEIKEKFSIVSLKMVKERLTYEKEIPPGIFRHIVEPLKENIGEKIIVKKLLHVIRVTPFNNRCKKATLNI